MVVGHRVIGSSMVLIHNNERTKNLYRPGKKGKDLIQNKINVTCNFHQVTARFVTTYKLPVTLKMSNLTCYKLQK